MQESASGPQSDVRDVPLSSADSPDVKDEQQVWTRNNCPLPVPIQLLGF